MQCTVLHITYSVVAVKLGEGPGGLSWLNVVYIGSLTTTNAVGFI